MYRFHPQWPAARDLVHNGSIGELKNIDSYFSYYNVDPANVRNKKNIGGGGLMDIGCYPISLSRFIFGREPERAFGKLEIDPVFKTDSMASAILDFKTGTTVFSCSTQQVPFQKVNIMGTEGRIELEVPFSPSPDAPARIWLHTKNGSKEIIFDATNQYTLQGDLFSLSILKNESAPASMADALNNMKVIDAIFESAKEGGWVHLF